MKTPLDSPRATTAKNTTYRNWSFRLFIYLLILNFVIYIRVVEYDELLHSEVKHERDLAILYIACFICLIVGIVFTGLSIVHKEERDYKYYTSVYAYPIWMALSLILLYLGRTF